MAKGVDLGGYVKLGRSGFPGPGAEREIALVRWFRNSHEQRNDWLRFGLMRLHRAGKVRYEEHRLDGCVAAGFDPTVAAHRHRHTSAILVDSNGHSRRCIVDSEDSFFCMSPLIEYADVYFCSGYNRKFFREKIFVPPYSWQQPFEVESYVRRAEDLVRQFGSAFDRVRPFVPIGPEMGPRTQRARAIQRLLNAHHKIASRMKSSEPWLVTYLELELRYRQLEKLRRSAILYDIVLLDTMWGWPRHRHALHMRLRELADAGKNIHSRLRWSEPSDVDGGDRFPWSSADFPVETGEIDDYEAMLAASRLAVSATGFHWGWRNIMTLALMLGVPIFADRLLLEPWFDMVRFQIRWNEECDWDGVAGELRAITAAERARIKAHNQAAFDDVMTPEKVAEYFIHAALSDASEVVRNSRAAPAYVQ